MRFAARLLMVVLPIMSVQSHAFDLSDLFKPRKKIIQETLRKHKKHKKVWKSATSKEPPRNKHGFFIVDAQWYANYLEQELIWNYWIPEDAQIKSRDGKIHVPPVVFRHYEDMLKTPRTGSNSY